jgi:hypothetical protein
MMIYIPPPQLHIEFSDDKDKITLEGPPQQVDQARDALETFARELVSFMSTCENYNYFLGLQRK